MQFKEYNFSKEYLHEDNINTFTYKDNEIHVIKYLPIRDKNDLITITLQKAEEDGIYNEVLLDAYFHLNIVYLYTDIEFEAEDREDEMELYDILETNGIFDNVIACLGEDEYGNLRDLLVVARDRKLNYENTAAAVIRRVINDLPKNAAAAKEIVDNFNPEQYQQVVDFATAANGGRNINTNAAPVNQETAPIKPPAAPKDHLKKQNTRKVVKITETTKKD